MSAAAIRVEALGKRFGDADALRDVTLEVRPREVVGLVGENGAGKSTLLKILAGVIRPDAGRVAVRGAPARWRRLRDAADAGIGLMFQEPALVPGITVAENILLGREGAGVRLGVFRWPTLFALAQATLDRLGVAVSPAAATRSLSFSQRQLVAFAKAVAAGESASDAPILLLDEPTSALDARGIETLLRAIEQLRTRASVVFVSHRLQEVLRVCDRLYVLKHGRCVAECDAASCSTRAVQGLMVGDADQRDPEREPTRSFRAATAALEVRQLSRRGEFADVSLTLHRGEVIGIAGAADSGCEELCRTLFGMAAPHAGALLIEGRAVALRDPADAVAHDIGYVPAERASDGVIGAMSVAANITLANCARSSAAHFIDRARELEVTRRCIERLRIDVPSPTARTWQLSGGNQQKVVLAKWLVGRPPRVLILDHPLRGLDVRARDDILATLRELAGAGVAILIVADTIADLLAVSDTVIVMRDGRISARWSTADDRPTERAILEGMV